MINWQNYEEYLMMHTDGELSADEEQELMEFVDKHPAIRRELEAYVATRSTPDATQVFTNKNALLKPVSEKKIALPLWTKYSIAAGLAALIFISLFEFSGSRKNGAVTMTDTAKTIAPVPVPEPRDSAPFEVAKNNGGQKINLPVVQDTENNGVSKRNTNYVARTSQRSIQKVSRNNVKAVNAAPAITTVRYAINETEPARIKPLPRVETLLLPPATMNMNTELPEYALQDNSEHHKKTFWEKLPIDKQNKKHLENIAAAVASAYDGITNAKQTLADKSLTISVEKRKLILSIN